MKQPAHIVTLFAVHGRPFRFNKRFVVDAHGWTHFLGSAALCVVLAVLARWLGAERPELWGGGIALGCGVLWEVGDGLKPLWYERPFGDWRDLVLRADGCSWSDIQLDFAGVVVGIILLQQLLGM